MFFNNLNILYRLPRAEWIPMEALDSIRTMTVLVRVLASDGTILSTIPDYEYLKDKFLSHPDTYSVIVGTDERNQLGKPLSKVYYNNNTTQIVERAFKNSLAISINYKTRKLNIKVSKNGSIHVTGACDYHSLQYICEHLSFLGSYFVFLPTMINRRYSIDSYLSRDVINDWLRNNTIAFVQSNKYMGSVGYYKGVDFQLVLVLKHTPTNTFELYQQLVGKEVIPKKDKLNSMIIFSNVKLETIKIINSCNSLYPSTYFTNTLLHNFKLFTKSFTQAS